MIKLKPKKGFTLIEILIVMGIIAILSAGIIIATNPGRQFAQARNTQRLSAVNSILNAIHQNMADNQGSFDFSDCGATSISTTTVTTIKSTGGVDLCDCLVPIYIPALPYDPSNGSYTNCAVYDTDYTIIQDATTTRLTIDAPSAELNDTINAIR